MLSPSSVYFIITLKITIEGFPEMHRSLDYWYLNIFTYFMFPHLKYQMDIKKNELTTKLFNVKQRFLSLIHFICRSSIPELSNVE